MTVQELKNLCRDMSPDQHDKVIDMLWLAIEGKSKEHSNLFKEIKDSMAGLDKKVALLDQKVDYVQSKLEDDRQKSKAKESYWYKKISDTAFIVVIVVLVAVFKEMDVKEILSIF